MQFFRGNQYDISEEIQEIQSKHLKKLAQAKNSISWNKIFSSSFLKPFSCVGLLCIFSIMSGYNVITSYMISILEESGSSVDPNLGPILTGSIGLVATLFPFLLVKRFSPRALFCTCHLVSTVALLTFAINSYVNLYYPDLLQHEIFGWLPIATLILADLMRPLGIGPVIDILGSELYPTEIRTQAIGITKSSYYSISATITIVYPHLKNYLGIHGVFFCFSTMCAISTYWGYLKIPDTRGKSLVKVEDIFEKENK